jgi:hypothetical protein
MNARQKRNALARAVVKQIKSLLVELKDLEEDIRQLWVEFDHLPAGEKILDCSTKKQFCEKQLGRTPRAVRYMLDGGNHKRGETVSPMRDDPRWEPPEFSESEARELHERHEQRKQERARREEQSQQQHAQDDVVRNFAKLMVKEGRRTLAIKYHPDKGGSADDMVAINAAEQRLSNLIDHWHDSFVSRLLRGAA